MVSRKLFSLYKKYTSIVHFPIVGESTMVNDKNQFLHNLCGVIIPNKNPRAYSLVHTNITPVPNSISTLDPVYISSIPVDRSIGLVEKRENSQVCYISFIYKIKVPALIIVVPGVKKSFQHPFHILMFLLVPRVHF